MPDARSRPLTSMVSRFWLGVGVADGGLDDFGGPLADQQVVLALDVLDDGLVHLVAGHPHGPAVDDAGQGDDRHLGRAAADVDDHVAGRFGDRKPGADRRGHGLFDQEDLPRPGRLRGFAHRALLHLGDPRRNGDDDARPDEGPPVVHLVDEVPQHGLGDFEVGDDPVAHRSDGHDAARGSAQHFFGLDAHRQHAFFARWLVLTATTEGSLSTMPLPLT